MKIPEFETIKQRNKWLAANKGLLRDAKKSTLKQADAISYVDRTYVRDVETDKALNGGPIADDVDRIKIKAIINTTNVFDSHRDVHFPGIWNKSLSETKTVYLLKQHKMDFDYVISDDGKVRAKYYDWKDLGESYEGRTQALEQEMIVERDDSAGMFEKYVKNKVKNHSVGMRYVRLELAIDDPDYKTEKAVWDKYIDKIVNKEDAEEVGYFWAVTEAKYVEGSAVVKGSNELTPTYSIEAAPKGTSSSKAAPSGKDTRLLDAIKGLSDKIESVTKSN